jgi:SOS response regulatory protein OraA/RecX
MKSEFLSGAADRSAKIEAAIREMMRNGYTKEWISNVLYNIGIDKRDIERALEVVESEELEAILIQSEKQAAEAVRLKAIHIAEAPDVIS